MIKIRLVASSCEKKKIKSRLINVLFELFYNNSGVMVKKTWMKETKAISNFSIKEISFKNLTNDTEEETRKS